MKRPVFVSAIICFGGWLSWAAEPVPDFRLTDANLGSNRHGAQVSPRDYLLQVSGYYFGDAG